MNLNYFETEKLNQAVKSLFRSLNIPISEYSDDRPFAPADILASSFKPEQKAHQLIDDVYFIGGVDDNAFGKDSEGISDAELQSVKQKYDGLFIFAVSLNKPNPGRADLAEIARALNREFPSAPVAVMFKYGKYISLAAVERSQYKQTWREGEKVGKVSILKDINTHKPHAGHLRIIGEFQIKPEVKSFEALYKQWQSAFDLKTLNKEFYKKLTELFYKLVGGEVKIGNKTEKHSVRIKMPDALSDEILKKYTVRLIGRTLFCWFLGHKHSEGKVALIPDSILSSAAVKQAIDAETNYFHSVMEPLFFETLNKKAEDRLPEFRTNDWQYIPYLNGGLFDPHIDGEDRDFYELNSLNKSKYLNTLDIPNDWFEALFNLFDSYYFTIDENTPMEQEVALDPELLGQVFENLLAEINPETGATARKQTGSFYTPREIVDYMVDESLAAYIEGQINLTQTLSEGEGLKNKNFTQTLSEGEGLKNKNLTQTLSEGEGLKNKNFTQTLSKGEGLKSGISSSYSPSPSEKGQGVEVLSYGVEVSSTFRYITTTPERWKILKEFAKMHRKEPTKAEDLLWQELRNRKLEFKFRRQHPIQDFIVDFVCIEKMLVIEVDGDIHEKEEIAEYDNVRTEILNQLGYRVIRFKNEDVLFRMSDVIKDISNHLTQTLSEGEGLKNKNLTQTLSEGEGLNSISYSPSPSEKGQGGEVLSHGVEVLSLPARLRSALKGEAAEFSDSEKTQIIIALDKVKILDPACGSGAFPMGVLHKILVLMRTIDPEAKKWFELKIKNVDASIRRVLQEKFQDDNWDYIRKYGILQDSIYGVDIQPIAVEISKLRSFLTLAIEEKIDDTKPNRGIVPLPNLEFKFVAANTLIALPDYKQELSLFSFDQEMDELREIRSEYFRSASAEKKLLEAKFQSAQNNIARKLLNSGAGKLTSEAITKVANWNPFAHSASDFFEPEWMFGISIGFDIVIGNPPYIQLQKDGGTLAKQFEKSGFETFARTGDIYSLFYEKGWQVLKPAGFLIFITSNKWMRAGYGEKTREFFAKRTNPKLLIDFAGVKIFESATVDTNILLYEKNDNQLNTQTCTIGNDYKLEMNLSEYLSRNSGTSKFADGNSWTIMNGIEAQIKAKIEAKGIALKDWDIKINYGIKTGYNEAFIIDGKKKDELIAKDPKSAEIIKPILRGRDIKRYKAEFADLWLINTHNGYKKNDGTKEKRIDVNNYPAIKNHLDNYMEALEKRQDKGETPYNLRSCAYVDEFEKEKIVYPNMTKFLPFVLDTKGVYPNPKCYVVTGKSLKYLLCIFNSKVCSFWIKENCPELLGGTREIQSRVFLNYPAPIITEEDQAPFIDLVDIILAKKENGEDTTIEENKIDRMVYELYDLTEEEIKIVENSITN